MGCQLSRRAATLNFRQPRHPLGEQTIGEKGRFAGLMITRKNPMNGASSFIGQHSQWFAQPVSGPHHTGQPEVSLYREKRYRIANGVRNRTHCPYFALVQPPVNGPQGIPAYLGHGRCVNHAKRQAP